MLVQVESPGWLGFDAFRTRCALGRAGVIEAAQKREGDLATPLGRFPLREVWFRPDRIAPPPRTGLACRPLTPAMGWCDDPEDARYNQHVTLPYPARCEQLWREDHVYDLLVVLGYNDAPVQKGRGSAIFWHLAQPDFRPTEGCVAIAREPMLEILAQLAPGAEIEIRR